jgi:membrane protease YdiL (CAAX protease family)
MSREEIFGEHFVFYIVLLLIFNPIMEEVLFRKLALDKLLVLGEVPAIFISAAFFGLPHAYSQGVPQMFGTFVLGLVWAYVRIKTGKLWPCMVLHMLFNLYGAYFTLFMAGSIVTSFAMVGLNMIILPIPAVILLILTMSRSSSKASGKSEAVC